jgi:hypothetical protein
MVFSVVSCRKFLGGKELLSRITEYVTKFCRQQAQVIQNHENAQGEADTGNERGLNLAAVKRTTVQMTKLLL